MSDDDSVADQLNDPIYHVSGAGPDVGLDAVIFVEPDAYTAYTRSYYGVVVMVHDPQSYPQANDKATFGQPGTDVTIAIVPTVLISQPAIRGLSLADRQCIFDDERLLRTTTKYTYHSCISECAVDTILQICDCLPFYYMDVGLKRFFAGRRQCTLTDSICLRDNRRKIDKLVVDFDLI